jgi:hypothetical protein
VDLKYSSSGSKNIGTALKIIRFILLNLFSVVVPDPQGSKTFAGSGTRGYGLGSGSGLEPYQKSRNKKNCNLIITGMTLKIHCSYKKYA